VCSIDVGINTAATLAIVDSTGTVIARKFLTCGRHNDQRDNLGLQIAEKQNLSGVSKRGQAFCSGLHRRIAGLSLDAARRLANEITMFAQKHGASLFVIEDLKGWKPRGPKKSQRQRFHRFQHRMLVRSLSHKAQELGMRMLEVYARGTSRYAYDGSGKVTRSSKNAQLATFSSGKQYNADLNGALNIAARGLAMVMGVKSNIQKDVARVIELATGKSSGTEVRMPLVLADIWTHVKSVRPALCENNNRNHMWASQQGQCFLCTDAQGTVA
jgi:IS605 OrfB family transposase